MTHPTLGAYSLVELSAEDASAASRPISLKLIVDVSGSMSPFMGDVINACLAAVDAQTDGTVLGIWTFDDKTKEIVEMVRERVRPHKKYFCVVANPPSLSDHVELPEPPRHQGPHS